jgi:hypothetical protein
MNDPSDLQSRNKAPVCQKNAKPKVRVWHAQRTVNLHLVLGVSIGGSAHDIHCKEKRPRPRILEAWG